MAALESPTVPYPKAVERFPRLRQSLLAAFDNCPLSAHWSYEVERGWSSHDQARGQIFHRFAAKALEEMAALGENRIEVDVALAILHECIRQHDVDPRDVVCIPARHIADLRMSTIKWAADNTFDVANLVSVEERLTADVGYPDGRGGTVARTLSGQLDAVFAEGVERVVVLDWKDTWGLPPVTDLSFGGYFQQRFYGLLVLRNYPHVDVVTLREFYHRYSEAREATVTRADLEDIEEEMSSLAERFDRAYEEEIWKPSPGKHCSYCPRPSACPIFGEARGEGMIDDEETARKVAAQAVVARAALDVRTKALKAYTDRHGPVPVADAKGRRQFGYVRTTRTERPSRDAMERAIREAGGIENVDVDALYRQRTATRFEEHTPPAGIEPTPEDMRLAEALRASLKGED